MAPTYSNKHILTHEELLSCIRYAPLTGEFFRIKTFTDGSGIEIKIGGNARKSYQHLNIKGKTYTAARVAFFFMTGRWPENYVDHKDRDIQNNKWENLREATPSQNSHNTSLKSDNTYGCKGISFISANSKWRAVITIERERIFLGYFDSLENAKSAYKRAAKHYLGDFAETEN